MSRSNTRSQSRSPFDPVARALHAARTQPEFSQAINQLQQVGWPIILRDADRHAHRLPVGTTAEDLAADVFVRVWRALQRRRLTHPSGAALRTYLQLTLLRTLWRQLAAARRLPTVALDAVGDVPLPTAADEAPVSRQSLTRLAAIDRALATLPARARAAWEARVLDGLSYRAIARRLGIGTVTAHRLVARTQTLLVARVPAELASHPDRRPDAPEGTPPVSPRSAPTGSRRALSR
jgi:RNA polymerase sigma factor (sigma-70 family)